MNELLIENLLLLLVLCLVAVAYLRMADKLNIIDKPNQRSSHTRITVRGGGVIFPVSLLLYSIVHGFPYLYFIAGLTLIAVISFADDLKHQSRKLRLAVHFAAVSLLLFQVNEMSLPYWLLPILFVLSIGVIELLIERTWMLQIHVVKWSIKSFKSEVCGKNMEMLIRQ